MLFNYLIDRKSLKSKLCYTQFFIKLMPLWPKANIANLDPVALKRERLKNLQSFVFELFNM
jgi:hypothetical protein